VAFETRARSTWPQSWGDGLPKAPTDNRLQIAHGSIKQAQARAGAAGGAIAPNQTGEALTATTILTGSAADQC